jgi:hypothetical protein
MSPRSGAMMLGVIGSSRPTRSPNAGKRAKMIPMLPGLGAARYKNALRAGSSAEDRLTGLRDADLRLRSNSIGALHSADTSDTSSYSQGAAQQASTLRAKRSSRLGTRKSFSFSRPTATPDAIADVPPSPGYATLDSTNVCVLLLLLLKRILINNNNNITI